MNTRATTTTPHRAPSTSTSATPATLPPGSSGLWILPVLWKTRAIHSASTDAFRRRVSHNTLDAADGAHRLHRQPHPCSRPRHHE